MQYDPTIDFDYTETLTKKILISKKDIEQRLSGVSAVIAWTLLNDKEMDWYNNYYFAKLIYDRELDYFLSRSIDVHKTKALKFLKALGFNVESKRQVGIRIIKTEENVN